MAKADLELPDGTKVTIDGTPEEVAVLLERIQGSPAQQGATGRKKSGSRRRATSAAKGSSAAKAKRAKPKGATDYIRELVDEDYFKTKRGLGDVKATLEERAHIYPVTTLSPVLFRLVKARELRRIKDGGAWKYVNQ